MSGSSQEDQRVQQLQNEEMLRELYQQHQLAQQTSRQMLAAIQAQTEVLQRLETLQQAQLQHAELLQCVSDLFQKVSNMELCQSTAQNDFKDITRHFDQFYSGELWADNPVTRQVFLQEVLRLGSVGQGQFPVQADQRRGIFEVTRDFLQQQGCISPEWYQGQVLLWLPEAQHELYQMCKTREEAARIQEIIANYQHPELLQRQRQAMPVNHKTG